MVLRYRRFVNHRFGVVFSVFSVFSFVLVCMRRSILYTSCRKYDRMRQSFDSFATFNQLSIVEHVLDNFNLHAD
jgi:hypothetical protein